MGNRLLDTVPGRKMDAGSVRHDEGVLNGGRLSTNPGGWPVRVANGITVFPVWYPAR